MQLYVDLNKSIPQQKAKWQRLIRLALKRGDWQEAVQRVRSYDSLFVTKS
jgi:hypothetical protein